METNAVYKKSRPALKSMLAVDFRRMFSTGFFYIMLGLSVVLPILILVMTTMSSDSADAGTMFTSVWQTLGSVGSSSMGMSLDLTTMCNINMMYFLAAVLVCVFVSEDFRSGYCKNLFTYRADKMQYVISKTVVGSLASMLMLLGYFVGAMLGGSIAGLSFDLGTLTASGITMSLISKLFLMIIFASIYVLMSVLAKKRTWLGILLSLGVGMFMFTIIPMVTPLTSTIMNVGLCLAGGIIFGSVLSIVSNLILKKIDLI